MSSLLGDLLTEAPCDLGLSINYIPETGKPVLEWQPGQELTQEELLTFVDEDFDD